MPNKGFSLVELSIVLVILGLLIGGVLTGQNLIKAAELRNATKEFEEWQTAVNVFKEKYLALPGDMKNATAFWGAANVAGAGGECAAPGTNTGTGTQTCNGDGSGTVTTNAGGGANATNYESFRFWQHLANAGLIAGAYTGVQGSGNSWDADPGVNVPRGKISNAGWMIWHYPNHPGDWLRFTSDNGQLLAYGANAGADWPYNPLLTPEEAWNIDTKMDDGKPGTGKLIAMQWTPCTLATAFTDITADFDLTVKTLACSLAFRKVF